MFDKEETIYIQEHDQINGESQKVFDAHKTYVMDISSELYLSLRNGFIKEIEENDSI